MNLTPLKLGVIIVAISMIVGVYISPMFGDGAIALFLIMTVPLIALPVMWIAKMFLDFNESDERYQNKTEDD
jgi:hypothetical protein|tara:strand:+ start:334 stop:549 length:216 start_codon:yes stop_codon:yes gene_type:complete